MATAQREGKKIEREIKVYSAKMNCMGIVRQINYANNMVTFRLDNNPNKNVHAKIDDVIVLEKVGTSKGKNLYDGDIVVSDVTNTFYELSYHHESEGRFYQLNKKMERDQEATLFTPPLKLDKLTAVGNRHVKDIFNFDMKAVKRVSDNEMKYYYVGNSQEKKMVDLIEITFAGHQFLDREYSRTTFYHSSFREMMEKGILQEVSEMELRNYLLGLIPPNISIEDEKKDEKQSKQTEQEDKKKENEKSLEGIFSYSSGQPLKKMTNIVADTIKNGTVCPCSCGTCNQCKWFGKLENACSKFDSLWD